MAALSLAVPAAVGAAAYIDAKYHIRQDWHLVSKFIGTTIEGALIERRDQLNLFYTLERWAVDPSHSKKTFLIYEGKSWTWAEAYQQVLKYGTYLQREFGVIKDEVIAIDMVNSDVYLWTWLGLWSIGAKPAFINYNLKERPLLHCLKTSTARLVLIDPEIASHFDDKVVVELTSPAFRSAKDGSPGSVQIVLMDNGVLSQIDNTDAVRAPNRDRAGQKRADMAILIYTSGTTGLPKPAVVSWAKVGLASRFCGRWMPLTKKDVFYTCMPLYHSSAAVLGFGSVLNSGAALSLGRKFHRSKFWDEVRESKATAIQYVGETCRYLLASPPSPKDRDHRVRLAFGNGLRPDVWPIFKARFGIQQINEFYAATEGPAALWNRSGNEFSQGAVGMTGVLARTLLGTKAVLLQLDFETNAPIRDEKTGRCIRSRTNEPGELVYELDRNDIGSQFQGYFGNSSATSSKVLRDVFAKGDAFFSTGDVMRCDDEGRWFFCDRIGDTFRWKSENVSTAEVAAVLGSGDAAAYIDEANVYGVEVPAHDGRAGCAAIILKPAALASGEGGSTTLPSEQALRAIHASVASNLPKYAIPLFLRFLSPASAARHTTGNNKQQKHGLRSQGIDFALAESEGDVLYWLSPGAGGYVRFGAKQLAEIKGGQVKL